MWSGRRGSNPRPTAWKAVTLPLSYSRLGARPLHLARRLRRAGPLPLHSKNSVRSPALRSAFAPLRGAPARQSPQDPYARLSCERRLMARGGFEPPKPLGRQIYSLLRLTASLPRRYRVHTPGARETRTGEAAWHALPCLPAKLSGFSCSTSPADRRAEIPYRAPLRASAFALRRDKWSWRRDLNPRPADYKSAALPD